MAEQKIPFTLVLDDSQWKVAAREADLDVAKLKAGLEGVAAVAGVIGAAYLAMKTALNLSLQADELKSLNVQFEHLARNAGVSGDAILQAMDRAADGLISGAELTHLANKAMVQLGANAERMPEIMELARKASVVFGTDVAQAFQEIAQAVSSGQLKRLKEIGINIDAERTYRDYARSIGVAENALSEAGKRQAIMNEVLAQGKAKLKDIDTSIKETTDNWTRLKNTVGDFGETIALVYDKVAGKQTAGFLGRVREILGNVRELVDAKFGDTSNKETAANRVNFLKVEIELLHQQLRGLQAQSKRGLLGTEAFNNRKDITETVAALKEYQAELAKLEAKEIGPARPTAAQAAGKPSGPSQADMVDRDQVAKNRAQFLQDLFALKQEQLQAEQQTADSLVAIEDQLHRQKMAIVEQADLRVQQIEGNSALTRQQKDMEIAAVFETAKLKELAVMEDVEAKKMDALTRYENHATSTFDGIARAFQAGSQKNAVALGNFGEGGRRVFSSFSNHAVKAMYDWAAGQGNAADAAKKLLFGVLADEAEARGKMLFLSSLWPPNPVGLAAGAGLIGLSAFLRAQSGGGGGGGAAPAAGGAPAGLGRDERPQASAQAQSKGVSIQVMGSYFETEQTKTRLVEMIREASDATDFSIRSIG